MDLAAAAQRGRRDHPRKGLVARFHAGEFGRLRQRGIQCGAAFQHKFQGAHGGAAGIESGIHARALACRVLARYLPVHEHV